MMLTKLVTKTIFVLALIIVSGCSEQEQTAATSQAPATDYAKIKNRVPYDAREMLSKNIERGGLSVLKISVKQVSDPFPDGDGVEFKVSIDVATQKGSEISTIMLSNIGGSVWYSNKGAVSKSDFTIVESTQSAELINNFLFDR